MTLPAQANAAALQTARNLLDALLGKFRSATAVALALPDPAARKAAVLAARDHFQDPAQPVIVQKNIEHHDAVRGSISQLYLAAIKRALSRVKTETLHKLSGRTALANSSEIVLANTTTAAADFPFDLSNFKKMFFAEMRGAGKEALDASGQGMTAELGTKNRFITSQGIARNFLIERENKMADVPQEIYDALKLSLEEGTNSGEPEKQLADRVSQVLGGIEDGRAQTIARTETASAYGTGRLDAINQAGFGFKSWLTADDGRVRDSHELCQAQGPIPADQAFANGLMYPGDPNGPADEVINCRCVLQAADAPEEEAA